MSELEKKLDIIKNSYDKDKGRFGRLSQEICFAQRLVNAKPDNKDEWQPLIDEAVEYAETEMNKRPLDVELITTKVEDILKPIGLVAKEYTIYCVAHAHIDMNWMWNWPETVSVINDTFSTMDRLMDEFPEFTFSQSQASTYQAAKDYLPELYEKIKERVKEGKWEIIASTWVEGDENLASGEILCRHLLYTKRFFKREFGMPIDAVKLIWQPDLFGHAYTVPGLLNKAGVKRYYFCRGGKNQRLFWWKGKDGSKVLAFDDAVLWYNGEIGFDRAGAGSGFPDMTHLLFDYEKSTGLKDYLFVYGVGDHGGGPTRRDLILAIDMDTWPIFPNVKLSTTEEYFDTIEPELPDDLPVIDDELNFVFPGCYTSQSNIKLANRFGENRLEEAEISAVLAWRLLDMPYPNDDLFIGWRNTMFNQFHDIIPGSGVKGTYDYAQGLFQETLARTGMVKTRALRFLASKIDTSGMNGVPEGYTPGDKVGVGIGAGSGHESAMGRMSNLSGGAVSGEPFVVFNPNPWERNDVALVKVWDKDIPNNQVEVVSGSGEKFAAQVIDRGNYWGHRFMTIAFPVEQLPAMGYRIYSIARSYTPASHKPGVTAHGSNVIENEYLKVTVDQRSGSVSSLIDKRTGQDLVPEGKKLGMLQWLLEAPHGMTAWEIGQIIKQIDFDDGATIDMSHRGPYMATIRAHHKLNDSTFTMEISLKAGMPRVDFNLNVNWLERGHAGYGVPMLKVVFPVCIKAEEAKFEIPCGYISRPTDGAEVPSQKWVDLTGERIDGQSEAGVTLLNDCKYGHNVSEDEIKLTLLRSSYDPDPLPELGQHQIRFAIIPHDGNWTPSDAARAGYEFNHQLEPVGTDVHEGDLPKEKEFISINPSNILLSGIKKAEDEDAIILRLYEMEGEPTETEIRIDPTLIQLKSPMGSSEPEVIETDILERPIADSSAELKDNILKVDIPAFGVATVKISL
ncbi:hypothetical protein GF312_17820 [Candidatus Poribacteria bacterium]|nr:hypothetical protein [Candidatus Poribacteria bacterium]